MFLILLSVLVLQDEYVPPNEQGIPSVYHGRWAPSAADCIDPVMVTRIHERRIEGYEVRAYLNLAQLNLVTEPPEFYGHFSFVSHFRFWSAVVRISPNDRGITVTTIPGEDLETPPGPPLVRCA
jgi:hypothetical protein